MKIPHTKWYIQKERKCVSCEVGDLKNENTSQEIMNAGKTNMCHMGIWRLKEWKYPPHNDEVWKVKNAKY